MNFLANRVCAWTGVAFVLVFLLGFWVVAGFVPPPSPGDSANEIAQRFTDDAGRIRAGMIISSFAAVLLVTWSAAIRSQLRLIEGRHEVWASLQFLCAGLTALVFEYILFFWIAATYRDDRPPDTFQAINDMAWLPWVGIAAPPTLQAVAIGAAILGDRRDNPVLPRWLGYLNLWSALFFTPGALASCFKAGPIAWNGLISWYLPLSVFSVWIVANTVAVLQALSRQETEHQVVDEVEDLRRELEAIHRRLDANTPF